MRSQHASMHRAFTLVDLLVTMTIIVVAGTLVIPQMRDESRLRVMAASAILSSDLELAQVMTIARPADPVVVLFEPAQDRYWLAYKSDPTTPILREGTNEDYLVQLGAGRALTAAGVAISLAGTKLDTLEFDAQGGVADFTSEPVISLSAGSETLTLTISPITGSVTQAWQ